MTVRAEVELSLRKTGLVPGRRQHAWRM